jgi:hypothetical protein
VASATAEAQGLCDELLLAGHLDRNRIEVNSDSKVIDVMNSGGNSLGLEAVIYEEYTLLSRNFTEIIFSHFPREANVAAHVLATRAEDSQSVV